MTGRRPMDTGRDPKFRVTDRIPDITPAEAHSTRVLTAEYALRAWPGDGEEEKTTRAARAIDLLAALGLIDGGAAGG